VGYGTFGRSVRASSPRNVIVRTVVIPVKQNNPKSHSRPRIRSASGLGSEEWARRQTLRTPLAVWRFPLRTLHHKYGSTSLRSVHWIGRLIVPHTRSERCGEVKNFVPLPGMEFSMFSPSLYWLSYLGSLEVLQATRRPNWNMSYQKFKILCHVAAEFCRC
jgi:hypothetical protein